MFPAITQFECDAIVAHRYGIVETCEGRFSRIAFRPWPKLVSIVDVMWLGPRFHGRTRGDRCWLYYNQPLWHSNFLALAYVQSTKDCRLATFITALRVLDEIARVKHIDAIVCDAWNRRISDRLLARWGWEPHAPSRWHRNYIKRFYGKYPAQLADASLASSHVV